MSLPHIIIHMYLPSHHHTLPFSLPHIFTSPSHHHISLPYIITPSLTSSHPPFLLPSHHHISLTSSHLPHILTPFLTSSHPLFLLPHIDLHTFPSHNYTLPFSLPDVFTLFPNIFESPPSHPSFLHMQVCWTKEMTS